MEKLSLVIPAYNEEKRIGPTLKEYSDFFEDLYSRKVLDYEILIVINNTRDRTEEVVRSFSRKNKKIRYLNLKPGGKGFAVIQGFKDALKRGTDLIGFTDADLATPPKEFMKLINGIRGCDGVIASRYVKGSEIYPKYSFRRTVVSRVFNFLVRSLFLLPHHDTQCGAKLFRKEAAEHLTRTVGSTLFSFDVELLYQLYRSGFVVKEVPVIWKEIPGGTIKVGKSSIQMFFSIIRLRLIYSPIARLSRQLSPISGLIWRLTS